jgi:hypothetical protein
MLQGFAIIECRRPREHHLILCLYTKSETTITHRITHTIARARAHTHTHTHIHLRVHMRTHSRTPHGQLILDPTPHAQAPARMHHGPSGRPTHAHTFRERERERERERRIHMHTLTPMHIANAHVPQFHACGVCMRVSRTLPPSLRNPPPPPLPNTHTHTHLVILELSALGA